MSCNFKITYSAIIFISNFLFLPRLLYKFIDFKNFFFRWNTSRVQETSFEKILFRWTLLFFKTNYRGRLCWFMCTRETRERFKRALVVKICPILVRSQAKGISLCKRQSEAKENTANLRKRRFNPDLHGQSGQIVQMQNCE